MNAAPARRPQKQHNKRDMREREERQLEDKDVERPHQIADGGEQERQRTPPLTVERRTEGKDHDRYGDLMRQRHGTKVYRNRRRERSDRHNHHPPGIIFYLAIHFFF